MICWPVHVQTGMMTTHHQRTRTRTRTRTRKVVVLCFLYFVCHLVLCAFSILVSCIVRTCFWARHTSNSTRKSCWLVLLINSTIACIVYLMSRMHTSRNPVASTLLINASCSSILFVNHCLCRCSCIVFYISLYITSWIRTAPAAPGHTNLVPHAPAPTKTYRIRLLNSALDFGSKAPARSS